MIVFLVFGFPGCGSTSDLTADSKPKFGSPLCKKEPDEKVVCFVLQGEFLHSSSAATLQAALFCTALQQKCGIPEAATFPRS